jgi:GMP synthase (glutamine-hydrolysing)
MDILIINCGSRAVKELVATTKKLGANPIQISIDSLPLKSAKEYDGIIISGSPLMWSDSKCQSKYQNKFAWIKTIKKPVLGVCFGHQTIGLIYGSSIRHDKLLKKKIFIDFQGKDRITKGFNKRAKFMEYHEEFISLPKKFILLGTSEKDNVEIFKHPTKPIYGTQFHPELSGKNGEKIFKNFFSLCKT